MASMEAGVKRPRGEPGAEDDKIDWMLPLARYETPWKPLEGICMECGQGIMDRYATV